MACPVPKSGGAFLAAMLDFIDCQAQTIATLGYQANAGGNTNAGPVLTAALTIVIAILGLRLILGWLPSLGDGIVAALRIGVVLLLATSWPAYRVIVHDVVLKGPAELVSTMSRPAALPGSDGGLTSRLQAVDSGLAALAVAGTGRTLAVTTPEAARIDQPRPGFSDDLGLSLARIAYLGSTIAALGIVRLIAALLLALGPFFAVALLFDATRGLFFGWLRVLAGVVIGAAGIALVLMIELALLEPYLGDVLSRRAAALATPAATVELIVICLAFAAILAAMIAVGLRIAFAHAAATGHQFLALRERISLRPAFDAVPVLRDPLGAELGGRSRAGQIADAIDRQSRADGELVGRDRRVTEPGDRSRNDPMPVERGPLWKAFGSTGSRTVGRVSAASARRSALR
jgi:type IV secretion system protein VirB6